MKKIFLDRKKIYLCLSFMFSCFLISHLILGAGESKSVDISPNSLHPTALFENWNDSFYTFSVHLDQRKYEYTNGPNCNSKGWSMIAQETARMDYNGPKDTSGKNINLAAFFPTHIYGTFKPIQGNGKGKGKSNLPEYAFDAKGILEGDYIVRPNYKQVDLDSEETTVRFAATRNGQPAQSQWTITRTWGGAWGPLNGAGTSIDFTPTEVGKYKIEGTDGNDSDYGELDALRLEWVFEPPYIGVGETKDVKVRIDAPPGCTKTYTFDVGGSGDADIKKDTLTLDNQWRPLTLTGTIYSLGLNDSFIFNSSNPKFLSFTIVDATSDWDDNYILCNDPTEEFYIDIWPIDLDAATLKVELIFSQGGEINATDDWGRTLSKANPSFTYDVDQIDNNRVTFKTTGLIPGTVKFKFTLKDTNTGDEKRFADIIRESEERDIFKLEFDPEVTELYVGEEKEVETKLLGPSDKSLNINYTTAHCTHIELINKTVDQKSDQIEKHKIIGKIPSDIESDDDFILAICPDDRKVEVNKYRVLSPYVNLQMPGVPDDPGKEPIPGSPNDPEDSVWKGGFVMVNDNNNDVGIEVKDDGLIDKEFPKNRTDVNLRPVNISWKPDNKDWLEISQSSPLKLKLTTIPSSVLPRVRIWKDAARTNLLLEANGTKEFTSKEDVPKTVYIEGIRSGASRLTLSYKNSKLGELSPLEDKLKITSVINDIDLEDLRDENRDGTVPIEETIGAFLDLNPYSEAELMKMLTVRKPLPRSRDHIPSNGKVKLTWDDKIDLYKTKEVNPENLLTSPLIIPFSQFGEDNRIEYYVNPVEVSEDLRDIEIMTLYSAPDMTPCIDIVRITNLFIDLDIDSDNNGTLEESPEEDAIEYDDITKEPGKVIVINNDDKDKDDIIDYFDWEIKGDDFDENIFPEVKIKIPENIPLDNLLIRLSYFASDPLEINNNRLPFWGDNRLWTKKSNEKRKSTHLKDGGDFVLDSDYRKPETFYTPTELFGDGNRERTFYLESIKDFDLVPRIAVKFIWKDENNEEWAAFDIVRVYPIPIDMDIDYPWSLFNKVETLPEIEEDNPGLLLGLNTDDDDRNNIPDYKDNIINGLADRLGDMSRLVINKTGQFLKDDGKVYLKKKDVNGDEGHVRIFDGSGNVFLNTETGSQSESDAKEFFKIIRDRGGVFFVEGIKPGKLTLVLEYKNENNYIVGSDEINIFIWNIEGKQVYDPKLPRAGKLKIKYTLGGWDLKPPPALELTIMDGKKEVASLVRKTDPPPVAGLETIQEWDGRWGKKKDGTDTADKDKYANPKRYRVEFLLYEDNSPNSKVIFKYSYDVFVARLGVDRISFANDQELLFHKTTPGATPTDLNNITFTDNTDFQKDVVWKIDSLDFLKETSKPLPRTEYKKEINPLGESFTDEDNSGTHNGSEWYLDADGNSSYTSDLRQVNFPKQKSSPTSVNPNNTVVEPDNFNRPVVYVRDSKIKVKVKLGKKAISDITEGDVSTAYPMRYPIRLVPIFKSKKMESSANENKTPNTNIRNIKPGKGPYVFEVSDDSAKLSDEVGFDVEKIKFIFEYNATGERYVDRNGNNLFDGGDTLIDKNDNGLFDEDWQEIPGEQETTHLIYRLADNPSLSDPLFMKVIDFTCLWGKGKKTPQEVFDKLWKTDNFWTPFKGSPREPDNGNGFHGKGDPKENQSLDRWGNAPMCYTYRHDLSGGFHIDTWLDKNYGRCGAWGGEVLPIFSQTHGLAVKSLALIPKVRVNRGGVVSFKSDSSIASGGNAVGDILFFPNPMGLAIKVDPSINAQANPAGQAFLQTGFNNHCASFLDKNNNSTFDTGELIFDPSYEHKSGSKNKDGYISVKELEDNAVLKYIYFRRIVVTGVDSTGKITTATVSSVSIEFSNDLTEQEMEGRP